MYSEGELKSWIAILLPLLIALVCMAELWPYLRAGRFGLGGVIVLMVAGVCVGIAWGAFQARRKG